MDAPLVLAETGGGIGRLTFNRPAARNAMSVDMLRLFGEELARMEDDPAVRCIVLQGAGAHFIAGGDVKSWDRLLTMTAQQRAADIRDRLSAMRPIVRRLADFPKPVVAAVRGTAAGAGIAFVAAADFVVAEQGATFVFANVRVGLVPDMGLSFFLPRAIGTRHAARLSLAGAQIDATEAHRLGLVTDLIPEGGLDEAVERLAGGLLALPRTASAETKRVMHGGGNGSFDACFDAEIASLATCAATDDHVEAISAFLERRKPKFA